ncbi:GPI ethanolamine phosphate transferase 2-like isoform X2 [Artemia franciscana]|uniref:GPI ethanolamine phosphate transferase 2-like isoform X2 n=1 Tax=Artemia franciscana TaxID=6661 RepID=UPI0032D9C5B4
MANYLKFDMHGYHLGLPIMLITLCVFFLIGFLPSLLSLQAYSNKRHIDRNNIVHKNGSKDHQKLVLVVVDALQRDFVLETNDIHVKKDWPFLRSLFTNRKACIFEGIADSPTVTMPRIKAMVSGTVPNFVDILYNLQSEEYFEDNLIDIAIQHKKAILFYGDDTWVKMFPGAFLRYEGTTSFFASDYTEVDVNVTRHLDHELTTTDWDIMILHYLGLDHIGHIHGPASFLVSEKLLEMDAVLEKIYTGLKVRNEPFTLLMTGDHGMSPGGSHGGSSLEETQVPLVFVNDGCIQRFASGRRDLGTFRQIDVTPTLAGLLGVPNPKNNLGVHIPNILFSEQIFSVEHQAVLMLENLKHLYNIFATRGLSSHSFEQNFDLLKTKLMESSSSIETRREWLQKAFLFAKEIQSELGKGSNLYDLWTMVISAFSMFLVGLLAKVCLCTSLRFVFDGNFRKNFYSIASTSLTVSLIAKGSQRTTASIAINSSQISSTTSHRPAAVRERFIFPLCSVQLVGHDVVFLSG